MPNTEVALIALDILFNVNEPEKTVIRTNVKRRVIGDLLNEWVRTQIGQGGDEREAEHKPEYRVQIQLDIRSDTFTTSSDTGNRGLTTGIVLEVLRRLDRLTITDLP